MHMKVKSCNMNAFVYKTDRTEKYYNLFSEIRKGVK